MSSLKMNRHHKGQPTLYADRGFTGHEYLPTFNIYNMNGRLYDPLVGRFLSPDNVIQNPASTQNYNRYTYCLNLAPPDLLQCCSKRLVQSVF